MEKKDENFLKVSLDEDKENIPNEKPENIEIELYKIKLYNQRKIKQTFIYIIIFIIIFSIISNNFPKENSYYKTRLEKHKSLLKGKKYFELCMDGVLLNNKTFTRNENPEISVVIPVYNSQDVIKGVIRSIQNQNVTNIEIILINDLSPDNTENVIKELQKEDERIILINNMQNRGTLYSRCIGVLSSKGKYIFTLDNDDLFYDETVFDEIYKEALKGNFDVVEFKAVQHNNYHINTHYIRYSLYSEHTHNLVLFQPELSQYSRKRDGEFGVYDCFLWGKIIKTEKYKKTVNTIGENVYSYKIIWGEDLITSFVLFRTIESFKFIGKHGIFRYDNTKTATFTTPNKYLYGSLVVYLDLVFNMTNNDIEDKKYVTFAALYYFDSKNTITCLSEDNIKYLNSILNKIIKCEYILDNDKKLLRKHFKKFVNVGIKLD